MVNTHYSPIFSCPSHPVGPSDPSSHTASCSTHNGNTWDPTTILQIINPDRGTFTCSGYAKTKGRRCWCPIARHNQGAAFGILITLTSQPYNANSARQRQLLEQLAEYCLCVRYHKNQVHEVVEKWRQMLDSWQSTSGSSTSSTTKSKTTTEKSAAAPGLGFAPSARSSTMGSGTAYGSNSRTTSWVTDSREAREKREMADEIKRLQAQVAAMQRKEAREEREAEEKVERMRQARLRRERREEESQEEEEERQRREEERKEREEKEQREREEQEERERQEQRKRDEEERKQREKEAHAERIRQQAKKAAADRKRVAAERVAKEEQQWTDAWDRYTEKWVQFKQQQGRSSSSSSASPSSSSSSSSEGLVDNNPSAQYLRDLLPWPTHTGTLKSVTPTTAALFFDHAPALLHFAAVKRAATANGSSDASNACGAAIKFLTAELSQKWHPDKMEIVFRRLEDVRPHERDTVTMISQIIIEIRGRLVREHVQLRAGLESE